MFFLCLEGPNMNFHWRGPFLTSLKPPFNEFIFNDLCKSYFFLWKSQVNEECPCGENTIWICWQIQYFHLIIRESQNLLERSHIEVYCYKWNSGVRPWNSQRKEHSSNYYPPFLALKLYFINNGEFLLRELEGTVLDQRVVIFLGGPWRAWMVTWLEDFHYTILFRFLG